MCSKVEYHLQRYLNIAELIKVWRVDEVLGEATRRLENVERVGKEKCEEFQRSIFELNFNWIATSLEEHLRKPEIRSRIVHWGIEECPQDGDSSFQLHETAKRRVEARISEVIGEWEDEHHHLHSIRKMIASIVQHSLTEIDTDVTAITRALTPFSPIEIDPPGFRFGFQQNPLNYIIHFLHSLILQFRPTDQRKRKAMFTQDPVHAMEAMSEETLKLLFVRSNLIRLISKAMGLDKIVTVFKEQVDVAIGNVRREVQDLRSKETGENFMAAYKQLRFRCLSLHTVLLKWELDFLFEGDTINSKDIEVKTVLLGSGMKTGYYRGRSTAEDKAVTVKRYAEKNDLRAILQDYKCLK